MIRTGTFWPTPQQELILQAAILEGEEALVAWNQWKQITHFNEIDCGSIRILPQIYLRHKELLSNEEHFNEMKGKYWHTWANNQSVLNALYPVFAALHQAQIPLLLLKGAALLFSHYKDFGLRSMEEVELLVPQHLAVETLAILYSQGWQPKYWRYRAIKRFNAAFFQICPAVCLVQKERGNCDLHWRALGLEEDLWQQAKQMTWKEIPFLIPAIEDQLFHICIHGAAHNGFPSTRWVSDAMTILKQEKNLDWNRLLDLAQRHQRIAELKETMQYLQSAFKAPLPPQFLRPLQEIPVPAAQMADYVKRAHASPMGEKLWKNNLLFHWNWHCRQSASRSKWLRLFTFPSFLADIWGLRSVFSLPIHFISLVWQRFSQAH